jgi:MYXO-CTERM domain-containing protein
VKMRSLEQDDISGICDIYGTSRPYNACDPTPRHGVQTTCGDPPTVETSKSRCASSTAPGQASVHAYPFVLVALGLGALRVRRLRSRTGAR